MSLHPLKATELEMIRAWRNAPAVRQAMYSHHEITPEEHQVWFQQLQTDASRRWYLYRDETDTVQGVVYFTDIDIAQGTAFWGFYARPDAKPGAPMGTGLVMALAALDFAFADLGLYKLSGEVLASNKFVVNLNKFFGFTEEGCFREHHHNGVRRVDIVRLGMLAREWPTHRERLQAKVSQIK